MDDDQVSEALHNRDDGTPQEAKDLAASISSSRTALLVAHHEGRAAVCATAVLLCDPKYLGQVRSSVQQILPKVRHTTHCYVTAEEIHRVHTRHDVASTSPRATLARFETMERLLVPVVPFMLVPRSRPHQLAAANSKKQETRKRHSRRLSNEDRRR